MAIGSAMSHCRFLQLVLYCFVVFTCGVFQNSFAPIGQTYKRMFNDTALEVSMFSLIIPIWSILFSLPAIYLYRKKGLRNGLLLGCLGLFVGGWVRLAGAMDVSTRNGTCWVIWTGQAVMAAGFPFLLAGAPLLSDTWFAQDERALATAFGGLAGIVGSVAASALAPEFFSGGNTSEGDWGEHRKQMRTMMAAEAAFASVWCCGVAVWTRDAPSLSVARASTEGSTDGEALIDAGEESHGDSALVMTLLALKDKQFLLLMVVFGCGYGSLNALTTLINNILEPVGYSDDDIGTIGAALGFGVLGSFVLGGIADATGRFTLILKSCAVVTAAAFVWFVLEIYCDVSNRSTTVLFVALGLVGAAGVPLVPIVLELGVETLFGNIANPQTIAGSLLWLSGNAVGIVAVLVSTAMADCGKKDANVCQNATSMRSSSYFLAGLMLVAATAACCFHGELRRKQHEMQLSHDVLSSASIRYCHTQTP